MNTVRGLDIVGINFIRTVGNEGRGPKLGRG